MKRFLLIFLLCLVPSFIFGSSIPGDNLGSHKAVMDLDMREHDINNPKLVDGVDVSDLKDVVEELGSSTLSLYYTNEVTSSGEYLLMTDTVPAGAESTITSTMDSAIVVITTFTVETTLGLSALRSGLYHSHFHAGMNNTNRDVRLRFEVYNGTGAAETFLFSSEQSNFMTADKTSYDIHVSTNEILTDVEYLVVKIVADVTGVAAAPILTFYMEGTNSSVFEMPALLSDVGVTKIVPGNNITISPTSGRGDVTINALGDGAGFTTHFFKLGGEASDYDYISTATPVQIMPVPTDFNLTGAEAFSLYGSTVGSIIFEIKIGTGTNTTSPIVWTSVSIIELSTGICKSGITAFSTDADANTFVGLFVNFVPSSGDPHVYAGVEVRYHSKEQE